MSKNREKYFLCPQCGALTTKSEILKDCSSGGMGMCDCLFFNGRIFTEYNEITKDEFDARIKERKMK